VNGSDCDPARIDQLLQCHRLQSIEIACDTLLSGKAKVMIAGGFDDISEEGSYEFANMKATSNSETEFAMGREPTEMSRPATTPVPASWSLRELVSISSCPPGPPSNSVLPSAVSSGSLPLPRETLVLCVCGVRSDPVDVTATRPDDPFLHQEWERIHPRTGAQGYSHGLKLQPQELFYN